MKKILITDDSPKWVEYHKEAILLIGNFKVDIAYCAKEGLRKVEENIDAPYDVILTDLQMESDFLPFYAGEWFVRQIKTYSEYKNSRVIIVSATSDIKTIAERNNVLYLPKYLCTDLSHYKIIQVN